MPQSSPVTDPVVDTDVPALTNEPVFKRSGDDFGLAGGNKNERACAYIRANGVKDEPGLLRISWGVTDKLGCYG